MEVYLMARISGIDLPGNKRVEIGLTYIFGIGLSTARRILSNTGVDPDVRCENLNDADVAKIRSYIDKNLNVEGGLRRQIGLNIKRLIDVNCYRGRRHRAGLPVRGQKSKTNARTRKGPRKIVANKK